MRKIAENKCSRKYTSKFGFSLENIVFLIFFVEKKLISNNIKKTVEFSKKNLKNTLECTMYVKKMAFSKKPLISTTYLFILFW